jgi:glycerol-3-phosphate cytidylyltransferase
MTSRIGYTSGVFDMFHIGHLNLLRRAREHCDHLIVGIATDELCHARKAKLPIVPFLERMEVVQNMRYVDEVVPQDHLDRLAAWEELRYDVTFKGDDWQGTPEWQTLEDDFRAVGVEVVYFPYTTGTSSTSRRSHLVLD